MPFDINFERFEEAKFDCDCKKQHFVKTKYVSFGSNKLSTAKKICENLCPNGQVLLVADKKEYQKFEDTLRKALPKFKACLIENNPTILDLQKIQQYSNANIVVSFGGENICEIAKIYANRFSLPHLAKFLAKSLSCKKGNCSKVSWQSRPKQ